jgi:cytochrome c oxidase cbb3-type subunit 2
MAGAIYRKPIMFAIVSAVVILIGTAVTMFLPMMTTQMHPKLENLKSFTPLELAGRDIYQREGCNNCHTQTVRPLKTEVMRYGEYSKAGEFAFDYPFLWGSKRTGPDLARIGGKYPDAWHYRHFEDPRKFFAKSNMPSYGWIKGKSLNAQSIKTRMDALGFSYSDDEIEKLTEKDELDALVAYMQWIGIAVRKKPSAVKPGLKVTDIEAENPLAGNPEAIAAGMELYEEHCAMCHGDNGEGDIGPSLVDNTVLNVEGDLSDAHYFGIISNGLEEGMEVAGRSVEGGMPEFREDLSKKEIWSTVSYIRSLQGK